MLIGLTRYIQGSGRRRWVGAGMGFAIALGLLVVVSGAIEASGASKQPSLTVESPRLVVLKSKRVAHLFDGDRLVRSYPIDLGTSPDGPKRFAGDGKTPQGRFHVVEKNRESQYHRFLGIDYPDLAAVGWGLDHGLISSGEAASLRTALRRGERPDWGTALGGGIGIHGHRQGQDWTAGCVAVSDRHIDELFAVMRIGDPVEILP